MKRLNMSRLNLRSFPPPSLVPIPSSILCLTFSGFTLRYFWVVSLSLACTSFCLTLLFLSPIPGSFSSLNLVSPCLSHLYESFLLYLLDCFLCPILGTFPSYLPSPLSLLFTLPSLSSSYLPAPFSLSYSCWSSR